MKKLKETLKKALEFDCSKGKCKTCKHKNEDNCEIPLITDYLIKQGYRKLPKDSVILTKEEYMDLSRTYIGEQIEQACKITVKELLDNIFAPYNEIGGGLYELTPRDKKMLYEKYDVEAEK